MHPDRISLDAGLTFDGRLMFYVDGAADGGRLVDTRSGAHLIALRRT